MDLLGLSEDELCTTLAVDPLTLLSGQLDHRPELAILLDLLAEAEERAGAPCCAAGSRASGPAGRPLDALLRTRLRRLRGPARRRSPSAASCCAAVAVRRTPERAAAAAAAAHHEQRRPTPPRASPSALSAAPGRSPGTR